MIRFELSRAQAEGLVELGDRAAQDGAPPGMGGKRFRAATRGIDRLRDAIEGHPATELDVEVERLADLLDELHDPDLLTRFRARLRDLAQNVRLICELESIRKRALVAGEGFVVHRAQAVLNHAADEVIGWQAKALDLIAAVEDGRLEEFGELNPDVYDLFELDTFEVALRSLRERARDRS